MGFKIKIFYLYITTSVDIGRFVKIIAPQFPHVTKT
jgi:hypothetical protein